MPQLIPFYFINQSIESIEIIKIFSEYFIIGYIVIIITLISTFYFIFMNKPGDSPVSGSQTPESDSPYPSPEHKGSSTKGNRPSDPLPGVKCPACLARGEEVWVLPGKHCPKCGHPC